MAIKSIKIFSEKKLIFLHPGEGMSDADRRRLEDAGKKANQEAREGGHKDTAHEKDPAREAAVARGREAAKTTAEADKDKKPATESGVHFPELPSALKGLKIQEDKKKTNDNGTVEYPFNFGDTGGIPGRIIMPANPKEGVKPKIIYNYVSDPGKFDDKKFLENLNKIKGMENAIVVTIRTPAGETRVNKAQVNTIAALTSELEKFQQDMSAKDPQYKPFAVRADAIIHMAERGEAANVKTILDKYQDAVKGKDSRAAKIAPFYNDADDLEQQIQNALNPADQPPTSPEVNPPPVEHQAAGNAGGGRSGRAAAGVATGGESATGAETPAGDAAPAAPAAGSEQPTTNPEVKGEGVNKLLILGDSLMYGTQGRLKANEKLPDAKIGKLAMTVAGEVKSMDRGGQLEQYRNESMVVNGGVNDIANFAGHRMRGDLENTPKYRDFQGDSSKGSNKYVQYVVSQIMGYYQDIWSVAKKYNIRVFQCTNAPFSEAEPHQYKELNPPNNPDIGKDNEEIRNLLNQELLNAEKSGEGPYKVIPLHNKKSEGGLAMDDDPAKLDPTYKAPDGLHLSGAGYSAMAAQIQGYLGEPVARDSANTAKPAGGGAPAGAETAPGQPDRGRTNDRPAQTPSPNQSPERTKAGPAEISTEAPAALINELQEYAKSQHVEVKIEPQLVYMGRPGADYQTMVNSQDLGGLDRNGDFSSANHAKLPPELKKITTQLSQIILKHFNAKELPFFYALQLEINGRQFRMPTAWHQHADTPAERQRLASTGLNDAAIEHLINKHRGVEVWPSSAA